MGKVPLAGKTSHVPRVTLMMAKSPHSEKAHIPGFGWKGGGWSSQSTQASTPPNLIDASTSTPSAWRPRAANAGLPRRRLRLRGAGQGPAARAGQGGAFRERASVRKRPPRPIRPLGLSSPLVFFFLLLLSRRAFPGCNREVVPRTWLEQIQDDLWVTQGWVRTHLACLNCGPQSAQLACLLGTSQCKGSLSGRAQRAR